MDSSSLLIVKSIHPDYLMILNGQPPLYKCIICRKTFKSKSNIAYHRNCNNNSEKPFTCEICSRKFSSKTHLHYHIRTHTGENPYNCDNCGKSFKTKTKLSRHREIHSKTNKEYSCQECGKLFLRIASLKVHQKYHVKGKSFRCVHCNKKFHAETNLLRHVAAIHSNKKQFTCDKCDKSFALKWSLKLHKRSHTGEQLLSCSVCHSKMIHSNLKRHMETHKNIIKLVCNICEKEFTRKDNLQRHITHMHSENGFSTQIEAKTIPREALLLRTEKRETFISMENLCNRMKSNLVPIRKESVIQYSKKLQPVDQVSVIREVPKESKKLDCGEDLSNVTSNVACNVENSLNDKPENRNISDFGNNKSQKTLEYPNQSDDKVSHQEYDQKCAIESCYLSSKDRVKVFAVTQDAERPHLNENTNHNQYETEDAFYNENIRVLSMEYARWANQTSNQIVFPVDRVHENTSNIHASISMKENVHFSLKTNSIKAVNANDIVGEENYYNTNNLLDLSMKANH